MDKKDFRLRFLRKKLYLKEFLPRANLGLLYYRDNKKAVYSVLFNVVDEGKELIIRDIPITLKTDIAIIALEMLVEILDPDVTHAMINSSWQLRFYEKELNFYRENPGSCMMILEKTNRNT
jgi:hypothetical protein